MGSQSNQPPLIVIVGETASGKTALAIALAQQFGGEIIAADSRTIYKGMSIGTAKPTFEEQAGIPHHLLDIITPDQAFSAAEFKIAAEKAIREIAARGKVPILVGGSGLYIDAVIFGYQFGPRADVAERASLQQLSVTELQAIIQEKGLPMPTNQQNPRHLMRVIESGGIVQQPRVLRDNTLVIGFQIDRAVLRQKLVARVRAMVDADFVREIKQLVAQYGWSAPGLMAPGYRAFRLYIEGVQTLEQAMAQFVANDFHLAKRQRTWFRRNKSIHWVKKQAEAVDLVTTFLNK